MKSIRMRSQKPELVISIFLVFITLAVYWQVQHHQFINFDDNLYVTENPKIRDGLTKDTILWAFTSHDINYWHPLTLLSHMVDCQLYGLNPTGHHFNNLLLHLTNTILLFLVLKHMTGALWRSAAVAALFALHPLNVESVAWIADRKNVLSTSFWMLTIWSYAFYAQKPAFVRYLMVFLFLAFGLMAKPMLVTLPFVLLLLDYWPLARFDFGQSPDMRVITNEQGVNPRFQKASAARLVFEKIPLLALSAASIYLSFISAKGQKILITAHSVPMGLRIKNALVSYVVYIRKMIWPHDLAVFYPYPKGVPFWQFAGAGLLLVFMTVIVIRARRRTPYLAVGWLWYVGTLIPVIGVVQQGLWPALADRFVYVPLVGLFIIVAWGLQSLWVKWRLPKIVFYVLAGIVLSAFGMGSWVQAQYWKNSLILFDHTLDVTADNSPAHMNLGNALGKLGREKEAIIHFRKALKSRYPKPQMVHFNLGKAFFSLGEIDKAIMHYELALRIDPDYIDPHINLGSLWISQSKWDEALGHLYQALQIDRKNVKAHNNLGVIKLHRGRVDEAITHFKAALRIDPEYEMAKKNLGIALSLKASSVREQVR